MSAVGRDLEPVTLGDIGEFARRGRWWLIGGALVGLALAVTAGLLLTKKYRADAVLAVVSPSDAKLGGAAGQLGGLASLVGIDIGGMAGAAASKGEVIETLRSRGLARRFIEQHGLLKQLYPDEDPPEHTLEQAVSRFTLKMIKVGENKSTGTISFSVIWRDRQLAADWARGLIALADGELRTRAVADAQQSIDYLRAEAQKTEVAELRDAIYRLIENNLRTIVIAKTRNDFAIRTVDPPYPPDAKDWDSPRRAVLDAVGLLLGLLAGAGAFALRRDRVPAESASADR